MIQRTSKSLLEAKLTWAISALLVSLAGGLVAVGDSPSTREMVALGVAALAQAALAWRAFVAQPPASE